ncbi:hypothetical protein Tco_0323774 [Tanacetum coccineum]
MELENTQNNALAKLPMLKLREYEMWEIRSKQYFQIQDYALWEASKACASSTNNINTVNPEVSTATTKVNTASTEICTASFSDATIYAFLSTQPKGSQLVHEDLEQLHDDDLEEMDLKWNMALLSMRARKAPKSKDNINWNQGSSTKTVKIEDASEKAMCAIDGAGFDWSDMTEEDDSATYKRGLATLEDQIVKYKEHEVLFSEEIALLKRSVGSKEYELGLLRTELEKVKQETEGVNFKIAKFDKSTKDLNEMLERHITDKIKKGVGYNAVPSPHPLILNRPTTLDLSYSGLEEFKEPEVNKYGPRDSSLNPTTGCDKESDNSKENTNDSLEQHQMTDTETSSFESPLKVDKDWKEKFFYPANHVSEVESKKVRKINDAPIIEDWVSDDEEQDGSKTKPEKKTVIPTTAKIDKPVRKPVKYDKMPVNTLRSVNTGRPFSTARSFNTVRPFYTAHPKSTIHCARPTVHMPFYKRTALTKRCFNQRFNTGRPFRSTVNTIKARGFNVIKPSACWVWRPIKPNGASLVFNKYNYIDAQGQSQHMTGNESPSSISKTLMEVILLLVEEPMRRELTTITEQNGEVVVGLGGGGGYALASPKQMAIMGQTYSIRLEFCDKHNMAVFLEKSTGSEGFHQVIDFLSQSHISYALTKKPEIYISFIKQFWRTAKASTDADRELEDHDGITSIPNSEIFEQLALMGYQTDSDKLTFQKGVLSPQWRFLIHTLLYCLSLKKTAWEQFSSNIATALICLATNRKYNFSRLIFKHMVTNIGSPHKFLMYPRFIQICLDMQKKQLKTHSKTYHVPSLNNKVFSNMRRLTKGYTGVEIGLFPTMLTSPTPESSPTPSSSPSRITSSPSLSSEPSTEPTFESQPLPDAAYHVPSPNESPLHAVHLHGSDEGSLKLNELTNLVTKLSERIGVLEDDLKKTKQTYKSALTKLILRIKKKISDIDEDPNTYFAQDGEVVHDKDTAEEGQPEDNTTGITVSTAPINISTARETSSTVGRVVYGRRSKEARKDKGKPIMTEPEPVKKSKKLLVQERHGLEEAIMLQKQVDEEEKAQIAGFDNA